MNQSMNMANNIVMIKEMPEVEQVYSVIKAMYEHNEFQESASKWLEELQKSVFAWKIADQLLLRKIDYQSCYFASQTLKTKILQSFNELPVDSYDSLKDSIINHLIQMNEKAIRTQLCLSLTYIIYMNPRWTNPIQDLSNKLPKIVFLEILICIAQEYDENRPSFKLTKKRRDEIEQYLSSHFANITQLLMQCFQEPIDRNNDDTYEKCLICFENWLNFAKKEHLKSVESILVIIFSYLKNPQTSIGIHEKASDALCKVIYQCEGHSNFSDLRIYVLEQVYSLEGPFQNALIAEDSAKLQDFTRIFVELGNSVIEFLIYEQIDVKIIQLILNCGAHYEFDIAEITFNFWYNFSDILRKNDYQKFAPFYNLLFSSITRHCQIENEFEGIIDEKLDVFDYRSVINDLISEICGCFDWVNYIKTMNILESFTPTTSWEIIEVHLYILYCLACDKDTFMENPFKNDVLPIVVNYILGLQNYPNPTHVMVYVTACDFLGEIYPWIHENINFFQPIVTFLLKVITINYANMTKVSTKAAMALKQILMVNNTVVDYNWIAPLFVELVNIYSVIEDRVELGVPLLACCTAILSNKNIEQSDQQEMFFEQLIKLCLNKITNVLNMKTSIDEHKRKWEKIIDNIYSVFKNFRPNEKTKNSTVIHNYLREHIWPFLKESITHFAPTDSQVIEHCSRCVRHIVRSMKPSYLLQPIVDHIVPLYQQYPLNSSLLYVGSVLVCEFGNKDDPVMADGLIRMLNAFSSATFLYLKEDNLNLNPYMIDDYFNLCTRCMTKLTDQFMLNTETFNGILNFALMAIYLAHKEANDSINKFLIEFITISHPIKEQCINNEFGRNMFNALIDSIILKLPGHFIPDMVETIWTFKTNYPQLYERYLQYATENLYQKVQKDGHNVSQEHLKSFYDSLQRATNPKQLVSEIRYMQRLFM